MFIALMQGWIYEFDLMPFLLTLTPELREYSDRFPNHNPFRPIKVYI